MTTKTLSLESSRVSTRAPVVRIQLINGDDIITLQFIHSVFWFEIRFVIVRIDIVSLTFYINLQQLFVDNFVLYFLYWIKIIKIFEITVMLSSISLLLYNVDAYN